MNPRPNYFVAAFGVDGQLVGVRPRSASQLTPGWLGFCRKLLTDGGPVFQCVMPQKELQHIALRFTSAEGAALVKFEVRGALATTAVALKGLNTAAEAEVLGMWVESMRRVRIVQEAAKEKTPFQTAFSLTERPVYIVVPWPDRRITEPDRQLVQELENHLAAAFLCSPIPVTSQK
jgi:hypothetical protein